MNLKHSRATSLVELIIAMAVVACLFIPLMSMQSTEARRLHMLKERILVMGLINDCVEALADIPNSHNLRQFLVAEDGGWTLQLPDYVHPRLLRYPNLTRGWLEPAFESAYVPMYLKLKLRITGKILPIEGDTLNLLSVTATWENSKGLTKSHTVNRLIIGVINEEKIRRAQINKGHGVR